MDDDDWEYEKLNSENVHECIDMNNNWIQKKYDDDAWSQEVQDEYDVVKGALIDYEKAWTCRRCAEKIWRGRCI